MEKVDKATRSRNMAAIRSKGNRSTELAMVSLLRQHKLSGWRRHVDLFGKPDFTWRLERIVLFVDGCFWHGCPDCRQTPVNNAAYWHQKIERNTRRDLAVSNELEAQGWHVLRVWECQINDVTTVKLIQRALSRTRKALINAR